MLLAERPQRAWVRQPSGKRFDLLNPDPHAWDDMDISIGLSRTFRWGGHSIWPLPLSVAQHSLLVVVLYAQLVGWPLSEAEIKRELLHDAEEALIGGFDPISPIKPFLGEKFAELLNRLQQTILARYELNVRTDLEYLVHKRADNIAAASEAVYVAGWEVQELSSVLLINESPLVADPLATIYQDEPWQPWESKVASARFLDVLNGTGPLISYLAQV